VCHPQLSNPSFPLRCVRRAATACAAHNRSCVYSSTMGCALLVPVERPAARCLGRGDYYIYYHPEAIANFAASGRCAATFSPRTRALPAQSHACVTLLCGPLRAYRYDDRRPRQNASLPHTQTLGTMPTSSCSLRSGVRSWQWGSAAMRSDVRGECMCADDHDLARDVRAIRESRVVGCSVVVVCVLHVRNYTSHSRRSSVHSVAPVGLRGLKTLGR